MVRPTSASGAIALAVLSVAVCGCQHEQKPIQDARAEAAAGAAQRLRGRWLLVSFQPEVPLEPALQLLVDAQLQRFVLDVAGSSMTGEGPGITVARTYRIDEAYLEHFKTTVYDQYGVGIEATGDFSGDTLMVTGITAPWRGRASFRRVQ
jgi:hypothetical protein